MGNTTHDSSKEVSNYLKVFGSLAVLTVITVAISNLKVGVALAVFLALVVATTKASLVASVFMHLNHEKKLIYLVLGFTVFFFVSLIVLMIGSNYSVPEGTRNLNMDYRVESKKGHGSHDDKHHGHDDHDGHGHGEEAH